MPFPEFDPNIFTLGPFTLRWYALAYIAGIILGWLYLSRLCARSSLWKGRAPLTSEQCDDILLWMTLAIIIGGRLGYVIFYNAPYYLSHPLEALMVWKGGMSFHGGAFGVMLALILFARIKRVSLLGIIDLLAAVTPIGLMFGRIANFINSELWGRVTTLPWGVVFPNGGDVPRHPSQLYEAGLEGGLILIILTIAIYRFRALHHPGLIGGMFMLLYAGARIIVELVRVPDAHIGLIGGLTLGQILSIPLIIVGAGLVIAAWRRRA